VCVVTVHSFAVLHVCVRGFVRSGNNRCQENNESLFQTRTAACELMRLPTDGVSAFTGGLVRIFIRSSRPLSEAVSGLTWERGVDSIKATAMDKAQRRRSRFQQTEPHTHTHTHTRTHTRARAHSFDSQRFRHAPPSE
jgi:hypothetical protein